MAVNRDVGGMQVREIQAISYPFFVDVRNSGMDKNSPVVANLPAVTMHWASPLTVDAARTAHTVVSLLKSTAEAWLRTNTDIQPNLQLYPGWVSRSKARESHILAVSVQGSFDLLCRQAFAPDRHADRCHAAGAALVTAATSSLRPTPRAWLSSAAPSSWMTWCSRFRPT
ncbi:hypothetical protein [Candidatus Amarolinea dominans]|uniref:Gldg family protein n=1 Tax=Candidatus Amarolinea dominans TaxID=3140696 RepID=UPI001E0436C6|nr:hypothetical protein [Anaerolineae bacterium]